MCPVYPEANLPLASKLKNASSDCAHEYAYTSDLNAAHLCYLSLLPRFSELLRSLINLDCVFEFIAFLVFCIDILFLRFTKLNYQ